jgi:hypothetical protein
MCVLLLLLLPLTLLLHLSLPPTCCPTQVFRNSRVDTRTDSGGLEKKLTKKEQNALKRGGLAKRAFKSKARFKRKH